MKAKNTVGKLAIISIKLPFGHKKSELKEYFSSIRLLENLYIYKIIRQMKNNEIPKTPRNDAP